MNTIKAVTIAFCVFAGNQALADLLCGEATHSCGVHLTEVRLCTINDGLSREELLYKLKFYELCAEKGGVVEIGPRNK